MARLARHRAELAFPAEVCVTPGTFDPVKALPERRELLLQPEEMLAEYLGLPLEIPIGCDTLVSALRHRGPQLLCSGLHP